MTKETLTTTLLSVAAIQKKDENGCMPASNYVKDLFVAFKAMGVTTPELIECTLNMLLENEDNDIVNNTFGMGLAIVFSRDELFANELTEKAVSYAVKGINFFAELPHLS